MGLLCIIPFYGNKGNKLQTGDCTHYSLDIIASATENFSVENKINQGQCGDVYKGKLEDGQEIAVKKMISMYRKGRTQFRNEVQLLSNLQHPNVVKLLGFHSKGDENMFIYEFASNFSLNKYLYGNNPDKLNWETRFKIIIGIARGLSYLNLDASNTIIHRDIKSTNILLDEEMNPKISDFNAARALKRGHIFAQVPQTKLFGSLEYMAPEYKSMGIYSIKSDVYSFGLLILEIISGQSHVLFLRCTMGNGLISHVSELASTVGVLNLVDPYLDNKFSETEVLRCIQVALLCVQEDPFKRPTMNKVLDLLLDEDSLSD